MRDWMKLAGIRSSEITDESVFRQRRRLLQASAAAGITGLIAFPAAAKGAQLPGPIIKSPFSTKEELSTLETVTTYNNFYELGTDKGDPARYADRLKTQPWSVTIDGECAKPGVYTLEDILKPHAVEERIYRMRCVEAWSMVIVKVATSSSVTSTVSVPSACAAAVPVTVTVCVPSTMASSTPVIVKGADVD